MKKLVSFLIMVFIFNFSFSQKPNEYEIEKNIKISRISLKINSPILYKRNGEKTLIGISLTRYSDSISYLWKHYDKTDTIGDSLLSYREVFMKNAIEIPTSKFDTIASQLKEINIIKVNNSTGNNIMDGNHYSLTFSGDGYQIKAETNSPEVSTKERGLEKYLSLCREIWIFSKY